MVRRYIRLIVFAVIAVLFVVFAVANREVITVTLYPLPYTANMPKFLLVALSFGLGILITGLTLGARNARSRRLYKSEHKRVMALQNELEGHRAQSGTSLPVTHA